MVKLTVVKAPKPFEATSYNKRYYKPQSNGTKFSYVYEKLQELEPGKALRITTTERKQTKAAINAYLKRKGLREQFIITHRGIKNPRMFYVSRLDVKA